MLLWCKMNAKCLDSRVLNHSLLSCSKFNGVLVSKETMVLGRWERSKQKFGFIKRVDKG